MISNHVKIIYDYIIYSQIKLVILIKIKIINMV